MPPPLQTYQEISSHLLTTASLTLPPHKPLHPPLTAQISSLSLHPTLEAALHILNHDLPSAHFLVRHMQAPPALEGMLLHGILHRCEGDMRNARLWIGDVGDACEGFRPKKRGEGERLGEAVRRECGCPGVEGGVLGFVYGEEEERAGDVASGLVSDVEGFRGRARSGAGAAEWEGEKSALDGRVREEMGRVLEWCGRKFGTARWEDATSAWVKNSEEVQKISNDMVSGGKGYREF